MNDKPNTEDKLNDDLNKFLNNEEVECTDDACLIPKRDGLVERVNKKMITNDGRELLV